MTLDEFENTHITGRNNIMKIVHKIENGIAYDKSGEIIGRVTAGNIDYPTLLKAANERDQEQQNDYLFLKEKLNFWSTYSFIATIIIIILGIILFK